MVMKKVLFVCVHNSGRSQMAEAFFNRYAKGKAIAESAGTEPANVVDPKVVQVMKEIGIDISGKQPRRLTAEMLAGVDRVVTMGCGVEGVCPASFLPTEDWGLEDPSGKSLAKIREIREQIESKVKELVKEILGTD
jgi:protein-tyrosine-phosphatase